MAVLPPGNLQIWPLRGTVFSPHPPAPESSVNRAKGDGGPGAGSRNGSVGEASRALLSCHSVGVWTHEDDIATTLSARDMHCGNRR